MLMSLHARAEIKLSVFNFNSISCSFPHQGSRKWNYGHYGASVVIWWLKCDDLGVKFRDKQLKQQRLAENPSKYPAINPELRF